MPDSTYDVAIIGAGIVGLSAAMECSRRFPHLRLVVLEKEKTIAAHQSSHNSGVIHSGIYYKPGSLKAQTCVGGAAAMVEFCRRHDIPHQICGKIIVATRDDERGKLQELFRRGLANGIAGLRLLGQEQLREIEPHCAGIEGLHVPGTGITDYAAVSSKFADIVIGNGGTIRTGCKVSGIEQGGSETVLETTSGTIGARYLVNCAGLFSDRLARMSGKPSDSMIIPFRGEYYHLRHDSQHLVRGLIYPVPDPRLPFLGVHFTRRVYGGVEAGPNAVLALRREGYSWSRISPLDLLAMVSFSGFWRMASCYWRSGLEEFYRSLSKRAFVEALQRLLPTLTGSDLEPGGAGVRAQAVRRSGTLVDDFEFVQVENSLHVINVPSPAATASIAIGRIIADTAQARLGLEAARTSA